MHSPINWIPILVSPAVGLVLGWIATYVVRHRGLPLAANLVLGLVGGFAGIFLFPTFDHGAIGLAESLLRGGAGALVFLAASKVVSRKQRDALSPSGG